MAHTNSRARRLKSNLHLLVMAHGPAGSTVVVVAITMGAGTGEGGATVAVGTAGDNRVGHSRCVHINVLNCVQLLPLTGLEERIQVEVCGGLRKVTCVYFIGDGGSMNKKKSWTRCCIFCIICDAHRLHRIFFYVMSCQGYGGGGGYHGGGGYGNRGGGYGGQVVASCCASFQETFNVEGFRMCSVR